MNFSPTDEQNALIESVKKFAAARIAPGVQARDREARVERALVLEMGQLGYLGPELPEQYGGMGLDCVTSGLLLEQIAYVDMSLAYVNLLVSLCGQVIDDHAQPHVKAQWLKAIISGEKLVAIALTEPSAGSDAARIALKASPAAHGFVLNGEKTSISMATQADVAVVFARTGTPEQGAKGISAFLVPMDAPGISRTAFDDVGTRCVGRGSIFFDNVFVPADHQLGAQGQGFVQVMQGFDYSRALIGLQCLAVARASLDETWAYVQQRETFGKPIAQHQGVSFPLAEAETHVRAARLQCLHALWLKDQHQPHTAEAAMCKWWGPKLAFDVIHQCLTTHGHGGYARDYPFEQRLRDVLGFHIGDGTAQIMKLIIARNMVDIKL
jgi:cyclohexanecarboxyl-CoA dehydrogenase